jgi:hypothetical protein
VPNRLVVRPGGTYDDSVHHLRDRDSGHALLPLGIVRGMCTPKLMAVQVPIDPRNGTIEQIETDRNPDLHVNSRQQRQKSGRLIKLLAKICLG